MILFLDILLVLENAYPIQVGAIELGNGGDGLLEVSITWEYDNCKNVGLVDGFSDLADNHYAKYRKRYISTFRNFNLK